MVASIGGSQGSVAQVLQDSQVNAEKQREKLEQQQALEAERAEQRRAEQNRIDDARRGNNVDVTV